MIKNTLIYIIIGTLFGALALSYGINQNTKDKYTDKSEQVENLKESIIKLDSAYIQKENKIDSLKDSVNVLNNDIDDLEYARYRIQKKFNDLKNGLDSVSIDSLARYIVSNFKGSRYKITDFGKDGVLVAFSDTTVRDIVKKDLDRLELKSENQVLDSIVDKQSKVISVQYKALNVCDSQKAIQANKIKHLDSINSIHMDRINELEKEAARLHRRIKIITYVGTAGAAAAVVIAII